MNIFHKIQLRIFGNCKIGKVYFINCDIHGVQKAIKYGYDYIMCELCLKNRLKELSIH